MHLASSVLLVALVALVPAGVNAQTAAAIPADARVVYVSTQRLSTESAPGKAGTARVQALQQQRSSELRVKQQALEATRQQLAKATTAEERARLSTQEASQRADFERSSAQAQQDLQNLQREISVDLRPKVVAALNEVLKGTKVEVVTNLETAIVWAAPGLDVTTAVIEKLNAAPAAPAK